MRSSTPRVAFFTDSYAEANGVARLSRELERYAAAHGAPLLCVYGGEASSLTTQGSVTQCQLRRSRASVRLESDLTFDPVFWRHYRRAERAVRAFAPDILHITGPSDVGQLGALLGHRLSIPMVGSWHTNVHQYAALRASRWPTHPTAAGATGRSSFRGGRPSRPFCVFSGSASWTTGW